MCLCAAWCPQPEGEGAQGKAIRGVVAGGVVRREPGLPWRPRRVATTGAMFRLSGDCRGWSRGKKGRPWPQENGCVPQIYTLCVVWPDLGYESQDTHRCSLYTHTQTQLLCYSIVQFNVCTHTHTHTYIPVVLNHHGAVEYLPFSTCTHIDPTTSPPLSSCHLIHFIYCPTKATSFDRSLTTARKSASVKRRGEV